MMHIMHITTWERFIPKGLIFARSIHSAEASIHQWSTIGSNFNRRHDWCNRIYAPKGQLVGRLFQHLANQNGHIHLASTPQTDDMHNLEEHGMKLSDSVFEVTS